MCCYDARVSLFVPYPCLSLPSFSFCKNIRIISNEGTSWKLFEYKVTRYQINGERLRFDDDIVFLGLSSRATNNFSRKLWRLANIERSRVTLPCRIYYKTHANYAKSEFTRESLFLFIFFFFFFEPYRFKGIETSDANFLGQAAIKQK